MIPKTKRKWTVNFNFRSGVVAFATWDEDDPVGGYTYKTKALSVQQIERILNLADKAGLITS